MTIDFQFICYTLRVSLSRALTSARHVAGFFHLYPSLVESNEPSPEEIDEALKFAAESHKNARGTKRKVIGEFIDELLDERLKAAER